MTETATPPLEAKPRSPLTLVVFLLFAPSLVCGTYAYHFFAWFLEQMGIISGSAKDLEWAGVVGLGIQFITLLVVVGAAWYFTRDTGFKRVYAGWLGAVLVTLPGILLRFVGPNNDQIGSLAQIVIALVGAGLVLAVRRGQVTWQAGSRLPAGLCVAALGIAPLTVFGALGSPSDALLNLLAGLSFGLLAALLMASTTGNVLMDALGIGALLSLLASALGYDGQQLILLTILPPFAFAIAALMPSTAGAAISTGLLAAAGLAFFDPTELTILLGDIFNLAAKACGLALLLGWVVGAVALLIRWLLKKQTGTAWQRPVAISGAVFLWTGVISLALLAGNRGFFGDRLFVILEEQGSLSEIVNIKDRNERLTVAYQRLTRQANQSQAGMRKTFDTFGISYTPYYLVNAMEVQGGTLVRLYLMTRPEVDRVVPSPRLRPAPAAEVSTGTATFIDGATRWNVTMIGADRVWEEFGARGQGIVVGQSDSGADGAHPALRDQYRGKDTGGDYNWFDPWDASPAPKDVGGHGTHTLGTVLGQNGIGIAPQATWIGCVNLNRNLGNPALYLDCMQFMLAPFPQDGNPFTDGDPTRAAHVLNNSWGCPSLEGCDPNTLKAATDNLRAAGIFVVVSAGNDGPNCETIKDPLSLYDSVFSVGAIDQQGNMADFSSRGPVMVDGSGRMKPDIVAPGVDIFSAMPGGTYGKNSGTSMAGPHLVGVVALLWSANPALIGDIDRTEQILIETAQPYTGSTAQGCFTGTQPNAAYGYGVVDAYAAVKQALGK
jgi:subtilisin family serine protease